MTDLSNQQQLDALRAKRAALHANVGEAETARADQQTAVAVAVASKGTAPDDWAGNSARADKQIEALRHGAAHVDVEISAYVNKCALAVAKVEQGRRLPAQRRYDNLTAERTTLLQEALRCSVAGRATAPDTSAKLSAIEVEIVTVGRELAGATADIAALSAV